MLNLNLLAISQSGNIFLKSRLRSKHDLYELWDSISFKTSSTSLASLEELILVLADEDASLFVSGTVSPQVDAELGGTEGVGLGAVGSFALKKQGCLGVSC